MSELLTLVTGLAMGESPRWHEDRLWFSDWGTQNVVAVDLEGKSEPILPAPSFLFCFDWLPDGRLLIVSGSKGILLCREPDGSLAPYADLASLANTPWKDIVVDGRGYAYTGNVGFHSPAGEFAPGILALVRPNGGIKIAADEIAYRHGMVVTPDNSTLIVAEAYANRLTAFDIAADGSLSKRRVWAGLEGGVPHGICLDNEGAIWYAVILPFDVLCLILFLDRHHFLLWNGCLTDINDLIKLYRYTGRSPVQ